MLKNNEIFHTASHLSFEDVATESTHCTTYFQNRPFLTGSSHPNKVVFLFQSLRAALVQTGYKTLKCPYILVTYSDQAHPQLQLP